MNHSLLSADRNTHLKIVTVALIAAIIVVAVGITARLTDAGLTTAGIDRSAPVLKLDRTTAFSRTDGPSIR